MLIALIIGSVIIYFLSTSGGNVSPDARVVSEKVTPPPKAPVKDDYTGTGSGLGFNSPILPPPVVKEPEPVYVAPKVSYIAPAPKAPVSTFSAQSINKVRLRQVSDKIQID